MLGAVSLLLRVLILIFAFATAATAAPVRAYVLYGQGGAITSLGMVALSGEVAKLDKRLVVTTHNWNDYGDVVASIRKLPASTPVILVGYSLGANATTWITNAIRKRKVALIVAYDPSIWSDVRPAGSNVKRALLYHNNGPAPWGHARIPGPQVETTETTMPHLAVSFSTRLHAITLKAVARLLKRSQTEMLALK